jgi:hypothetical protein
VAEKATRYRKAAIQNNNDKMHVWSPNFQVEDYVLVAEHSKGGTSNCRSSGRARVASVESSYVVVVKNLLTKELDAAHANTLEIL